MKKLIFFLTGLIAISFINAQSLDEIVKKYSDAIKSDQLANLKTIRIEGKMSMMGMEIPLVMLMKNPDKIKVTYNFNGKEMISVFDGEKGYTINPMTGSSTPVELTGAQLDQVRDNNAFRNNVLDYFNNGQLTLEGDDNVDGKPVYKLKISDEGSIHPVYFFIDKETYYLVKTTTTVSQMGQTMVIDSFMTDYVDINGVIMPKKTTSRTGGMEVSVITLDNIEVNIPLDDNVFKLN